MSRPSRDRIITDFSERCDLPITITGRLVYRKVGKNARVAYDCLRHALCTCLFQRSRPLSGAINEFTPGESRSINRTHGDNDRRVRRGTNSLPPHIYKHSCCSSFAAVLSRIPLFRNRHGLACIIGQIPPHFRV